MNVNLLTETQLDDIRRACKETGLRVFRNGFGLNCHGYLEGFRLDVDYWPDDETFDISLYDKTGKPVFELEEVRKDFIGKFFS